ncbi:enoyl-CoA hydratase [Dyadobacter luteus]|jgi:methylglutaconyl-CoA hydratase|uniref:Enoyl-CoA hydratase n=1 Tax=Dyadobacter luteus TaxID=2259619 RepID=A0A3D8YDY3_9BACT|nr:enoyl-CoA hydratase-related protein [Dyadobacter luteus]REA62408.1 enoyl-CoA hydratase [Dyadobacter luteus]
MQFYREKDIQKFDQVRFVYVKTELKGHVFRITLNRPEKRNAFTPTMVKEITYALAYAHYTPEVRCVILEAKGPVFCAGADLNAFHNPDADIKNESLPEIQGEARLGDAFSQLLKPSIALVEGPVLAGGFLLICGCTFVLSVSEATFSLPEVKRGIWPMQVMESLTGLVPARKIMEMAITGKSYSAAEALEMGLLTQVISPEQIQREADKLADLICENAPYAIQSGLKAFQKLPSIPAGDRHRFLKEQLDFLLLSEDAKEGTAAFREKRNPIWKGK